MSDRDAKVAEVFAHAAELSGERVAAYLDAACGGDAALRDEVESLLAFDRAPEPVELGADPPAAIGRFEVIDKLGEGGMGIVYRARDATLGRDIAVKIVGGVASQAARDRLLLEAQAMARVAHPNVVAVYEAGIHDRGVFIAMELVPGETLAAWLRRPRAPLEILEKLVQAGRGLAAAHRAGVLHRDFKLDNVVIGDDGRARVLDFGLASPLDAADGAILGTPAYMSPEHFAGAVGPAADQWSFAVSLYRALFGAAPFPGDDALAVRDAVLAGEPAVPDAPEVPPRVIAAVLRGLRRAPEERWPSVDALVDELERELARERTRDPWRLRRQRRRGAVVLVALGVANLVVLGARTGFRFDLDLRGVLGQAALAFALVAGCALALHRAMRASAHTRNVFALFLLCLAATCVHRWMALGLAQPLSHVLHVDAVYVIGFAILGALAIDRWLIWVGGVFAGYLAVTAAWPLLLVPAFGLSIVVSGALVLWFWRDDQVQPHHAHGSGPK